MKTFENVASLKLAKLTAGQFVETGGYYSKGDGGGARYLIVTPQAADEYGDHTLANGNVALLQSGSHFNVLTCGLVGDGTTDNDAAFFALAARVSALSGGQIYFPEGVYYMGAVSGRLLPSDCIIYGDGQGATTLETNSGSSSRGIFSLDGRNQITIRDMTLASNRAGDTISVDNTAIHARNTGACSNIIIEDVEIRDFGYYAIDIRESNDIKINRVRMTNIGRAGFLGIGVVRCDVHNCFIKDISPGSGGAAPFINRFGIVFSMDESTPGQRSQYCSAVNNWIENVDSWEGIDTHGGTDLLIKDNTIKNCAIGMFVGSATSTANLPPERVKLIGNTFINTGNSASRAAILLSGSPDGGVTVGHEFIVSNNYIEGYGTHDTAETKEGALDIGFARDISVTGNNFSTNRYSHIRLKEDIISCVITGNTFRRGVVVDGQMWVLNAQNADDIGAIFESNVAYREGGILNGIWIQAAPSNESVYGIRVGKCEFVDLTADFEGSSAGRMHSQSPIFTTVIAAGKVTSAGILSSGIGIVSVAHLAVGEYEITLTESFTGTNFMYPTASCASTTDRNATTFPSAENACKVYTFSTAATDNSFQFQLTGRVNAMP